MDNNHNIPPISQDPSGIMNSLEGLQKASPGPFFFTRLQARLQKEEVSLWGRIAYFVSKPSFALTTLVLIFLLNAAVLFYQRSNTMVASADQLEQQLGGEDYNTTLAANSYYDENTDAR